MAIRICCQQCQTVYNLVDSLAGKDVRCKKCTNVMTVPKAGESRAQSPVITERKSTPAARMATPARPMPAKRSRRPRDEDDEERSAPISTGWIIGGVAALVLLVVGGVTAAVLASRKPADDSQSARNDDNKEEKKDAKPNKDEKKQQKPEVKPDPVRPDPKPIRPDPKPIRPDPKPQPPVEAMVWNASPDVPQTVSLPDAAKGTIPIGGIGHLALFPTAPSPFALVSQLQGSTNIYEVWDLRTVKKAGTTRPGTHLGEPHALSPDGAYVASKPGAEFRPVVDVWTIADGKKSQIICDNEKPGTSMLRWIDFAGDGRLVTAKTLQGEMVFQVWDLKSQSEVCSFTPRAHNDVKMIAVSAGRKYLAVVSKTTDRVMVYDLGTGKKAGEAAIAKERFAPTCLGLAFSPDGKALAALFNSFNNSRIIVWDMATGKAKADHAFTQNLQQTAPNGFVYKGPALDWLPDNSGWLVCGALFVDGEKGSTFWKIPVEGSDSLPRRIFDMKTVARVKGDFRMKALALEALPGDQIAAALKAVRSGADPTETKLPAPKAADWTAVRTLPPAGAGAWKAMADPAPERKKLVSNVPLLAKATEVTSVLFSAPDSAQALVVTATAPSDVIVQKQVHVERYDLSSGKDLGGFDLFSAEPAQRKQLQIDAAFSPDGALVAVREPKDGKRVDVWSLADKKHVAGWSPCEKEGDGTVRWVGFLDAGRVLTVSGTNKLVLWDAATARAIWSLDGCRGVPAVSGGRKLLAVHTGTSIEVLDATGERQGRLAGQALTNVWAAAFRPDGKQFAAVVQKADNAIALIRWDATTGEAMDDFPVPMISSDVYHNDLKWVGPDHVLNQNQLIDLRLKWVTFSYNIAGFGGKHAIGTPDGRQWFVTAGQQNAPGVLVAQTLPDAVALSFAADVAAKKVQPVLGPGMTVSVRVDGAGPAGDTMFRTRIADNVKRGLLNSGLKLVDAAPISLVISFAPERDSGQKWSYRIIGGLGVGPRTTEGPIQIVDCRAALTDSTGKTIWERKQSLQTPEPFRIQGEPNQIAAKLNSMLWSNCQNWGSSMGVPSGMVRTPNGIESLPKMATMTGDR